MAAIPNFAPFRRIQGLEPALEQSTDQSTPTLNDLPVGGHHLEPADVNGSWGNPRSRRHQSQRDGVHRRDYRLVDKGGGNSWATDLKRKNPPARESIKYAQRT